MSEPLPNLSMPFAELLGIEVTKTEKHHVTARMLIRRELCTANAVAHGGALMAFADSIGAIATVLNLKPGDAGTTTVESKTNFVRAAKLGETVLASTTPIHIGRRTHVWQTRLETEDGKLIALVTQTQMIL